MNISIYNALNELFKFGRICNPPAMNISIYNALNELFGL